MLFSINESIIHGIYDNLLLDIVTIIIRKDWLRSTGWMFLDQTGCYAPKSVKNKHCFPILIHIQHQQNSVGPCSRPVGGEMVHNLSDVLQFVDLHVNSLWIHILAETDIKVLQLFKWCLKRSRGSLLTQPNGLQVSRNFKPSSMCGFAVTT